ncbi:hypothetical protein LCGC14_1148060 [marine sediment metagenome]|uniref:NADAR domain-containing protein n=1 Tax=marine sediment metagenome TaxID=412755 RepID=A0A0F9Q1Y2_9ZZZZ
MIGPFTGKYRFLSNFWPANVFYEGILYSSAEHAYQAAKTLIPTERLTIIYNCPTPRHAKRMGKTFTLRKDWDSIKLRIMEEVVFQKFRHNKIIHGKLVLTGNEELVEVNYWKDRFWGIYQNEGENHLGKILMIVRERLS